MKGRIEERKKKLFKIKSIFISKRLLMLEEEMGGGGVGYLFINFDFFEYRLRIEGLSHSLFLFSVRSVLRFHSKKLSLRSTFFAFV
jgi:hypothetical protein